MPTTSSIDLPRLEFEFLFEREALFGLARAQDSRCHVVPDCWPVLEAVPRATADSPNVVDLGVAIDEEVAIRRVLILADARFEQRGTLHLRESAGQIGA